MARRECAEAWCLRGPRGAMHVSTIRADRLDAWDQAVGVIMSTEPTWADRWYEEPQSEADTMRYGSAEAERRFFQRHGWNVVPVEVRFA